MEKLLLFLILFFGGCSSETNEERVQRKRDNIISIKDRLMEFNHDDVILPYSSISVGGHYLVLEGEDDYGRMFHVFSRESLAYIGSFGKRGQGPGEMGNIGSPVLTADGNMYVTDYGHYLIYQFNVDSALQKIDYLPQIKRRLQHSVFPSEYQYISDTLSYGVFVKPISASSFEQVAGKWNLKTGEMQELNYQHPDLRIKRIHVAVSLPNKTYVEANNRYDLISYFNLEGLLKWNVYGPNWDKRGDYKQHFTGVFAYHDYLIASYNGSLWENHQAPTTLCVIFDMQGNYVKTLDIGYSIARMMIDEQYDRLLFCLDDAMQFAYLDLKEVL